MFVAVDPRDLKRLWSVGCDGTMVESLSVFLTVDPRGLKRLCRVGCVGMMVESLSTLVAVL